MVYFNHKIIINYQLVMLVRCMINKIKNVLITLFGGMLGIHKFFDEKIIEGLIYLITLGLGFVGWTIDFISSFLSLMNVRKKGIYVFERIASIIAGIIYILVGVYNFDSSKNSSIYFLMIGTLILYMFNNRTYIDINENAILEEELKNQLEISNNEIEEQQIGNISNNINKQLDLNNALLEENIEKEIPKDNNCKITQNIVSEEKQQLDKITSEKIEREILKQREFEELEKYNQYRKYKINKYNNKKLDEDEKVFNNYCENNYDKLIFIFYNALTEDNNYKIDFNNNSIKVKFDEVFYKVFNKYNSTNTLPKENYYYDVIKEDLEIALPLNIDKRGIKNVAEIVMGNLSNDYDLYILSKLINFNNMKYIKNNNLLFTKQNFLDDSQTNEIIYELTTFYIITKMLIKVIDVYNKYNNMDETKPFYKFIKNSVNKYVEYDIIIKETIDLYKASFELEMDYFDFLLLIYILSESKKFEIEHKSLNFEIKKIVKQNIKSLDEIEKFKYEFEVIINNKNMGEEFIFSDISKIITILCSKYSEDGMFCANKKEVLKQIFYYYTLKRGINCLVKTAYQFPSWENKMNEEIKKYNNITKTQKIINNDFVEFDLYNYYENRYKKIQDGYSFEIFLTELFRELGYRSKRCGHSGDQGGDLEIYKNNTKYIIQAKHYAGTLNNMPIQEVLGAKKYYDADKCLVITNSSFTKGARELAEINEVILIDGSKLEKIIELLKNKNNYKYIDIFKEN